VILSIKQETLNSRDQFRWVHSYFNSWVLVASANVLAEIFRYCVKNTGCHFLYYGLAL
jgi:hypothetical protein